MRLVRDMYTGLRQRRIVITVESREMFGIAFGSTISTEEPVLKIDGHFGHDGVPFLILSRCYLDGSKEVLLGIRTKDTDGQLGAGEDNRLIEVLQHEGESRRRIRHRIRTVEDDESIISAVPVVDELRHTHPTIGINIRRVDEGRESFDVHLNLAGKEFRHKGFESLYVRRNERLGFAVTHHCNGAAGRYQKYFAHGIFPFSAAKLRFFLHICKIFCNFVAILVL